jgi:uncharacterized protein
VPSSDTGAHNLPARRVTLTPRFDAYESTFWTAGSDGGLHLQRCNHCSAWNHPPLPRCRECYSADVAFQRTSGFGRVYSFTVNHQRWLPALAVPYVIAVIEPDEDETLRLYANLIDVDVDSVAIGMQVEIAPVLIDDSVWLPAFRPRHRHR